MEKCKSKIIMRHILACELCGKETERCDKCEIGFDEDEIVYHGSVYHFCATCAKE